MYVELMHSFLAAVKCDFLSDHIKSGSLAYFNLSNLKLKSKEDKDVTHSTLRLGEEILNFTYDQPFSCDSLGNHHGVHT